MSQGTDFDLLSDDANERRDRIIVPVIEEQVQINKRVVETATVHIAKVVHENVESFDIPVNEEKISIERITKNELIDQMPEAIRYEGDVMIVSVLKEVAVVVKKVMLVEEVRITKVQTQKVETHTIALRKEVVEVQRTELNPD